MCERGALGERVYDPNDPYAVSVPEHSTVDADKHIITYMDLSGVSQRYVYECSACGTTFTDRLTAEHHVTVACYTQQA
jgi:hypothetical protein